MIAQSSQTQSAHINKDWHRQTMEIVVFCIAVNKYKHTCICTLCISLPTKSANVHVYRYVAALSRKNCLT